MKYTELLVKISTGLLKLGTYVHMITDCVKLIQGSLFSTAIVCARAVLITLASLIAPPLRVGTFAEIKHNTPL
jgi:hypothetical protein